jgi:outer membrane lipoprotein carrier protein
MKKLSIVLVCLLLVSNIFAQTSNALDPEADALLKAVTAKYQKYTSAKIDLKLTIDVPEVEENEVLDVKAWIKGDKFKVELKDQIFISDNVTLWNYLKEYNEVQINDYDESDAIFSPSILFNLYTKDYIYRVKEEYKNSAGLVVKVIELTPIKKDQDFFKIELKIDKANVTILEAKIFERSGMRYTYTINSLTPNVPLSDDFFKFNPSLYKGIEIIDARF